MKRRAVMAMLMLSLAACGGESEVAGLRHRSLGVSESMTAQEVRRLLGEPGLRSIRPNREAWQYCESAISSHTYLLVMLEGGRVDSMTLRTSAPSSIFCGHAYPVVEWGPAPPTHYILEQRVR
ncbi:hypothetical protein GXW78_00455 [Roseomonas terrae]|jgi:hypothetical protein|uniref:Lipoprotein SmpA/OmlA domain-containing protein n=1 Tax=Neoroseomonas terrae TaxID=424799 RepID=A0ABS5EBQ4_9PROT|nr:hypothetical protein [Neoroseomonas terrae]MBR0648117.1 hypothetical protein [Neoroseomonas terrae]